VHQPLLSWARWAMLAAVVMASVAFAQSSSVFVGTVRDALSKKPVQDVIVIITAPEKLGEEIAVTDDTGSYRVSQLPPGTYKLRFEKENFHTFERQEVSLSSHKTLRINIELAPSSIDAEEEVVIGSTPAIDVGSTALGITTNEAFVRKIPLTRPGALNSGTTSFAAIAQTAPGVEADAHGFSIAGTTSPENAIFVDGLSVTNPGYGTLGTFLSAEFMQDVTVLTGGFMPEYGRTTGGVISAVTKSGSNTMRGSVFMHFSPGALTGKAKSIENVASQYGHSINRHYSGEFGFDLGGPIVKDTLWFYVGFAPSMVRNKISAWHSRLIDDSNPEERVFERLGSSTRNLLSDNRGYSYIAKLSYRPVKNHNLSLQVSGAPSEAGGNGRWPAATNVLYGGVPIGDEQDSMTLARAKHNARDLLFKYAGAFWEQKFLVDAHLGWHHQRSRWFPDDDSKLGATSGMSSMPQIWVAEYIDMADLADKGYLQLSEADKALCRANPGTCAMEGFFFGGRAPEDTKFDRVSARAMGTLLFQAAGHHVLKAGVDAEFLSMDALEGIAGGRLLVGGDGYYYDYERYGVLIGPDYFREDVYFRSRPKSITYGAFVQDSWSIFDKLTLNAGFRWDQQQLYDTNNRLALVVGNQWSPRVGVIYDFMHNGKSKIFASYARLYQTVPLHIIKESFPGRRTGGYNYYSPAECDFANADVLEAFGQCVRAENRVSDSDGTPNPSQYAFATNNQSVLVDPKMKPQSTDEVVAGIEYEVLRDARLGLSYTRRYLNHVIENMSRDDGFTYFIGNPGFGIAKEFPKAVRNYSAFTLVFNKAFSDFWFVQSSYTYATLKGNYAGLFRPGQLTPHATTDFDSLVLMPNQSGFLPVDVRHNLRAQVSKGFEFSSKLGMDVSLGYYGMTGSPTNAYGNYKGSWGRVLITPRGSGQRLPWYNVAHAGAKFNVRLSKDSVLTLGGTVFNLFNFKSVVEVDETFTLENVLPSRAKKPEDICFSEDAGCTPDNPNALLGVDGKVLSRSMKNKNFGRALTYQSPISARLEARITF